VAIDGLEKILEVFVALPQVGSRASYLFERLRTFNALLLCKFLNRFLLPEVVLRRLIHRSINLLEISNVINHWLRAGKSPFPHAHLKKTNSEQKTEPWTDGDVALFEVRPVFCSFEVRPVFCSLFSALFEVRPVFCSLREVREHFFDGMKTGRVIRA